MGNPLKIVISLLALLATSCVSVSSVKIPSEAVLLPGMAIHAVNKHGTFSISYVDERSRRFSWNGSEKIVRMHARAERFAPQGMFDSQGYLGLFHSATGRSELRLVVQEAERHFDSLEQAEKFLYQGSAVMDWVFTDNGLMMGFVETPSRNQINITVWQILIKGAKPTGLPGSRSELKMGSSRHIVTS